ncbi:TetR/AcrR family transcriptional regulator [Nisaea sp.]|uniref:TetR/AcrR family transcriptional regulator n=1 Tax=Nisaea sp. TaxID=2024842 RepID=UPI003262F4C6
MTQIDKNFPDDGPVTEKQRQIVNAACKLFTEQGYEITSMDKVAAEANVSKRTVYSYFDSKEHLFSTVMGGLCVGFGEENSDDVDYSGTLVEVLTESAHMLMSKVTDPDKLRFMRTVIREVEQFPLIGESFWCAGPGKMREEMAEYFLTMQEKGLMKKADPVIAAAQFQSVIAGPFLIQTLFSGTCDWTPEQATAAIDEAVDGFIKAYAPD